MLSMYIKRFITLGMYILILFSFACTQPKKIAWAKYPNFQHTWPFSTEKITLNGVGTNVTVNKSAGVTMTISYQQNELLAKGKYDSKNLFGRFDLKGKFLPCFGRGNLCMQFVGYLEVGNDGSGFPQNTQGEYVMSINLSANGAHGVYRVNNLPSIPYEQQGILELYIEKP